MFTKSSLLLALATLSIAAPTLRSVNSTSSAATSVNWYQGPLSFTSASSTSDSASCGTHVATGNLTEGTCTELYTLAMGISSVANQTCTFTMWKSSTTCSGTPSIYDLPAGDDTTCINTGVLDGGDHYTASGIWQC